MAQFCISLITSKWAVVNHVQSHFSNWGRTNKIEPRITNKADFAEKAGEP